ncbi:hypothetical protein CC2G_007716 [Coprinopsis cinerea AmutBmut pab1-1]|nr:hypothetical protein CC2G_007716 [Coprinopsis cinerea AmutBmut pab1-1]
MRMDSVLEKGWRFGFKLVKKESLLVVRSCGVRWSSQVSLARLILNHHVFYSFIQFVSSSKPIQSILYIFVYSYPFVSIAYLNLPNAFFPCVSQSLLRIRDP